MHSRTEQPRADMIFDLITDSLQDEPDKNRRYQLIYDSYPTKEQCLAARELLEQKQQILHGVVGASREENARELTELEEHFEGIKKSIESIENAIAAVKNLPDQTIARGLEENLRTEQERRAQLTEKISTLKGISDPEKALAAISQTIEDINSIVGYFTRKSKQLHFFEGTYKEKKRDLGAQMAGGHELPIGDELTEAHLIEEQKRAEQIESTARTVRRSIKAIKIFGRKEPDEISFREKVETFIGPQQKEEKESMKFAPDEEEMQLTLLYANFEDTPENRAKVKRFQKTAKYLEAREEAVNSIKVKPYEEIRKNVSNDWKKQIISNDARTFRLKSELARLFTATDEEFRAATGFLQRPLHDYENNVDKSHEPNFRSRVIDSLETMMSTEWNNDVTSKAVNDLQTNIIALAFIRAYRDKAPKEIKAIPGDLAKKNPNRTYFTGNTQREVLQWLLKNQEHIAPEVKEQIIGVVKEYLPHIASQAELGGDGGEHNNLIKVVKSLCGDTIRFNSHDGFTMEGAGRENAMAFQKKQRAAKWKKELAEIYQVNNERANENYNLMQYNAGTIENLQQCANSLSYAFESAKESYERSLRSLRGDINDITNNFYNNQLLTELKKQIATALKLGVEGISQDDVPEEFLFTSNKEYTPQIEEFFTRLRRCHKIVMAVLEAARNRKEQMGFLTKNKVKDEMNKLIEELGKREKGFTREGAYLNYEQTPKDEVYYKLMQLEAEGVRLEKDENFERLLKKVKELMEERLKLLKDAKHLGINAGPVSLSSLIQEMRDIMKRYPHMGIQMDAIVNEYTAKEYILTDEKRRQKQDILRRYLKEGGIMPDFINCRLIYKYTQPDKPVPGGMLLDMPLDSLLGE